MSRVKAVQQGTNADLIVTAQTLYPMAGNVLDLTPGDSEGFWRDCRPLGLHYLTPGADFRRTDYNTGSQHHVVFDPPYVTKGGHKTSTIPAMNKRYGMLHVEKTPMAQWERQIVPGLVEAKRVLAAGGLLWFKLQDYVTSGRVWWFAKMALTVLDAVGFDLVDEFILDGHPGPQPTTDKCKACKGQEPDLVCTTCGGAGKIPRRQVHAARAHSVLLIARSRK